MGCPQSHFSDMFAFLPSRPPRRRPATVSGHTCLLGEFPLALLCQVTVLPHCSLQRAVECVCSLKSRPSCLNPECREDPFGVGLCPSTPSVTPRTPCPAPLLTSLWPRVLGPLPSLSPCGVDLEEVVILPSFLALLTLLEAPCGGE